MTDRRDPELDPYTAPEPGTFPVEHDRTRRSLLARLLAPLAVAVGVLVKFGVFVLKFFGIEQGVFMGVMENAATVVVDKGLGQ